MEVLEVSAMIYTTHHLEDQYDYACYKHYNNYVKLYISVCCSYHLDDACCYRTVS